ncbi:hypothetical protein LOAG_06112 [Loa loa]|uniref:Uncharacterized protein n=1 Tax=Loa loa TaxID=7209 RepID=A0A1S0TYM6_LOALO|nr:hypothetical protein LOAG_06112 [Loa loa]EFO22375.2 hypothetical protein LOAG_06112 [Loa loa]
MIRKGNTLNRSRFGLCRTSTRANLYGFNLSNVNNSEGDNDDSALLLNVRFIPNTEDMYREFCNVSKLNSSNDEGFRSSISQGTSTNNHLSAIRAAITGDALQLLYLINILKVSVNTANSQGITLLHWATANDHIAVVQLLLSLGADFRLTTVKSRSVLHTAACNDATSCLKLFLKLSFEQEKTDGMKRNSCGTLNKFILQRDFNGDNLLHLACRLRKKRCLKQCNQDNQTPVHVACLWNSVEAADLLLTDNLNKIVNKICNLTKRTNIAIALRETSRRALFWKIGRLETRNVLL